MPLFDTIGTEGGIRVNHKELIALTNTTLTTSSSWLLKRQAAVGASVIAQKLGKSCGKSPSYCHSGGFPFLLPLQVKSAKTATWTRPPPRHGGHNSLARTCLHAKSPG